MKNDRPSSQARAAEHFLAVLLFGCIDASPFKRASRYPAVKIPPKEYLDNAAPRDEHRPVAVVFAIRTELVVVSRRPVSLAQLEKQFARLPAAAFAVRREALGE